MLNSLFECASESISAVVYSLGYHARTTLETWRDRGRIPAELDIEQIEIVEMQEPRLLATETNRSYKAWCWSLEPAIVHRQLLDAPDGSILCYTDADVLYFSDPIPTIHSVMEHADVALSPHYFEKGGEKLSVGIFNFGAAIFRVCDRTKEIVSEWLEQTLERCDESVTDQMYLDRWPEKLGDRLMHLPPTWNVGPWRINAASGSPPSIDGYPIVSVHYHEFRRGAGRNPIAINGVDFNRTNYLLSPFVVSALYEPYEEVLRPYI